jgi:SAM-dependent methyltransferase
MYKGDLAYIQHHGFSDFAEAVSPGVLGILRDQSSSLVKYAHQAAPKATVKVGSVHRTMFLSCDAITALGEVLSCAPADIAPLRSFRRLIRRAHDALRPGGLFVFDLLVSGRRMDYATWRIGPTWAVMARVQATPARRRLTRDIVTIRSIRGKYRRRREQHVLAVFEPRSVLADLRRVGFFAHTAHGYGRVQLPWRRMAFIARKHDADQRSDARSVDTLVRWNSSITGNERDTPGSRIATGCVPAVQMR